MTQNNSRRTIFSKQAQTSSQTKNVVGMICVIKSALPCPSFPFFLEKGKENHQKNKDSYQYRTPEIPGKEGKNSQKNKEFLAGENKAFKKKNKERKVCSESQCTWRWDMASIGVGRRGQTWECQNVRLHPMMERRWKDADTPKSKGGTSAVRSSATYLLC